MGVALVMNTILYIQVWLRFPSLSDRVFSDLLHVSNECFISSSEKFCFCVRLIGPIDVKAVTTTQSVHSYIQSIAVYLMIP